MKLRKYYFAVILLYFNFTANAQTIKTVGGVSAHYSTLKAAFDAINSGSITGSIILQITGSTTETASAVLNASGSGSASYTSVRIYPTGTGFSISGNVSAPLIDFNGADSVVLDGRVNATGTSKDLIITNPNTGSASSTIKFENSAENNTLKYCYLKGSEISATNGVIYLYTSVSGNGNDNNVITNNDLTADAAGRPVNLIYSNGSTNSDNSSVTISNNNFYNFLNPALSSFAINLFSNNNYWTISGNSFYETNSFAPTSNANYNIIYINNSGLGFNIADNFIGGSASQCGGSSWSKTLGSSPFFNNTFSAIYINSGIGTGAAISNIQNNTIKNFNWSNSGAASWNAINIIYGAVNVGSVNGNIIGSSTDNNSITVTGGADNTNIYGININTTGTVDCRNNVIGSITGENSSSENATNVFGIYKAYLAGTTTISNNVIGSPTVSNSIKATSLSTIGAQTVQGIYNAGIGNITISNNTIANLTNYTNNSNAATAGLINGIASTLGSNTITNNSIHDLSIANANNSSANLCSACGMALIGTSNPKTVSGNKIYNISNSNTTFSGSVMGIYFMGGTSNNSSTITANFIYGLSVSALSTSASIYGIKINSGYSTYANNIISLGGNTATTITGIYETGASGNSNAFYFNTINITGSLNAGSTNKSYAIYSATNTNVRTLRNNLLINTRSTSLSSSMHYSVFFNYTSSINLILDNNDYIASGTGGILGNFNSSDVNTLPLVSGLDINSLNISPGFANPSGTLSSDYIPSSSLIAGGIGSGINTDYNGSSRAGTPTIGAFEGTLAFSVEIYKSGVLQTKYTRLKDVFDNINNGTHIGALDIKITSNTVETSTATLFQSGYTGSGGISSYSSINLYPVNSNLSITGNIPNPLIDLNGAANVVFDGRINGTGATKSLTFTNLNTSTNASTLRFINSANHNTIKYCIFQGSETFTASGVIYIANSSSGSGNSNNLIDNNDITNAGGNRPLNGLFSYGAATHENSNNIISNNHIFDVFNANIGSNGIYINSNSIANTVSGNSFYETTHFIPTAGNIYNAIRVSTSYSQSISGNYIGGSAPNCGGTQWNVASNFPHYFCAINVSSGSTVTTIQNNIIKNINYTSTQSNPWDGIYIGSGLVDVIGNTVGETTGTNSIIITTPNASAYATISGGVVTSIVLNGGGSGYTSPPIISFSTSGSTVSATAHAVISNGVVTGVVIDGGGSGYTGPPSVNFDGATYSTSHAIRNFSAGPVNITGNYIGSITTVGSTTYSHGWESIILNSLNSTVTVSGNSVGSPSTPNSIYTSSTASSSLVKQDIYGIYSMSIGTTTISGNTVSNLTNGYMGSNTGTKSRGILTSAGNNIIDNNVVRNITVSCPLAGNGTSASLIGIAQQSSVTGTTQLVTNNKVFALFSAHPSAKIDLYGIYSSGSTSGINTINDNFVDSLVISSSNIGSALYGILLNSGVTTCANNIVTIGKSSSIGILINGIRDNSGTGNNSNIYFNTVYIGGNVSSGTTSSTAAFLCGANTSVRDYRNNIFVNLRTGGTTGKHYAIDLAGNTGLTINYNDYYAPSGVIGRFSADKTTLALWQAATGQDANSINVNPGFSNSGGNSPFNYYPSASLTGGSGTGIIVDYDGLTRGAAPKMGALEINNYIWQGGVSNDFSNPSNWLFGSVPPNGADISFASTPSNHCVLDQNRSLHDIINAQSTYKFITNGKQISITGSLVFSNGAQMDATSSSSVVVFNSSTAQNIPVGALLNNTIDGLTINNPAGVTLQNDLTIQNTLNLTNGSFTIGPHVLTLNGPIIIGTGTLTGGSSTDMIIGGSGAGSIPALNLNNFTLNRAAGVTLNGSLSVIGTLTLDNGTLTLGGNSFTFSGNTLNKTNGNINASNTLASMVFNNSASITLPASLFSGNVNNLSLIGSGGLVSQSNFQVNGVLNLASANPSATRGLLDMGAYTLTMGANATTIGIGDVTGIVKRTSFLASTEYTFGNQYSTMTIAAGGIMPSFISFKISMGAAPSWKSTAVQRVYDIIQNGGSGTTVTFGLHYLDSEIQANTESNLVIWDFHSVFPEEHGKANQNINTNWVAVSNRNITYFASSFDVHPWGISNKESASFVWQGTPSSDWNDANNWSGGIIPSDTSNVVIPDATTTLHDPLLPSNPTATVKTITIQNGGILDGGTGTGLTITGSTGAWLNMGTFNCGTSTVTFTHPNATMADPTNFYNLTIANGAALTPEEGNVMRIAGTLTNNGTLRAALLPNTIEFNGADQTIINPNGLTPGYYNLILSGSGTKTLPSSHLHISGDLTTSESTIINLSNSLAIHGDLVINTGSTVNLNNYTDTVGGNIYSNGILSCTSGNSMLLNGTNPQTIFGNTTINFCNLKVNNPSGVNLNTNANCNSGLNLITGNLSVGSDTLGISGSFIKTSGTILLNETSSLSFGGSTLMPIPNEVFSSVPSINNLIINNSGGVLFGNQSFTINGQLNLAAGTLTIGSNSLTINGNSPVRTTGNMDASDPNAGLVFSNLNPVNLPSSLFTNSVNNFSVTGIGGVTSSGSFTIAGILNLQGENPTTLKGILDMGSNTLTLSDNATVIGTGDVTGIVKRTYFQTGMDYSFSNPFTKIKLSSGATLPNELSIKTSIGVSAPWKSSSINRYFEIIHDGGVGAFEISLHYLDKELNGNEENQMTIWKLTSGSAEEKTLSSSDITNDWNSLTLNLSDVSTQFGQSEWTLADPYSLSFVWNGSKSNAWELSDNWTPNKLPTLTSNVTIPDAATVPFSPLLSSLSEIDKLSLQSASNTTIGYNGKLTVNNLLTNNSSSPGLVIKSTADGTGSLITGGSILGSGTFGVEQYLKQDSGVRYHYISYPVASSLTNVFLGYYMYKFNEPTNSWANMYIGNAMEIMKGYSVYKPNMQTDTRTFVGTVNTGLIGNSNNLTRLNNSGGWNLVGNPYPSAIDWNAGSGWTKNHVSGAIYTWNQTKKINAYYVDGIAINGGSNIIAPMQGFMVRVDSGYTSGTLIMNNSIRVHDGQHFMKQGNVNLLRLKISKGDFNDETVIRFNNDYTQGFDSDFDAYKLFSDEAMLQLYTISNNNELAVNSLPKISGNITIPLGLKALVNDEYSISWSGMDGFDMGTKIYLEDVKLNTMTSLMEATSYSLIADPTDNFNRFKLHFVTESMLVNSLNDENTSVYCFENSLYIKSNKTLHGVIEIFDLLGKCVFTTPLLETSDQVIPLDQIARGCYMVKVNNDDKSSCKKIILK